jgi:chaperonin GroEL (HSP60 family)
MTQSCKAPFTILASNAGLVISKSDLEALQPDEVYDFRDFEVVNYLDGGIVDPTLVPVSALTNSSSVAKTILKSNSIISEWQEE